MPGSWISIRIRSGRCFATAASAASPLSASVTDFVVGGAKHIANDLAIILLVFYHENALAHAVCTCCATRTGTVKANVEP